MGFFVAPTHRFRNRQVSQRFGRHLHNHRSGLLALHLFFEEQPFAFVCDETFCLLYRDAIATRPAFSGFGWLAIGIKRNVDGRTTFFNDAIRLAFCQIGHFQCQTAWRGKPSYAFMGDVSCCQFCRKIRRKGFSQCAQLLWWQLFCA
ncbi:Uncharacterised protein [Vibrio cholerae]|nr:Uncharacterised protein [Vibrio cholerae]